MEVQPKVNDASFHFIETNEREAEVIDTPKYSYWQSVWRTFGRNKVAIFFLVILAAILLMSFIQPMFSGYDPMNSAKINDLSARYIEPNSEQWFGTDANGQSLFDATWSGAKTSISITVLATLVTTVIGVIVGAFWGMSQKVDVFMLEVYNIFANIPFLLIVMVLSYSLGNGFWNLLFAMTLTSWIFTAYFIRVQVMIMRDREYNLASRTLGTPASRMIFKNILPYLTSIITTDVSRTLPAFIGTETFLSFIGVGLSADVVSLGGLINRYSTNISSKPYLFWIPVSVLALVSVSLYIVGQALADATDPKNHI
ncbi:oligopeptide ABC transporter permease OppC [Facklamia miroungae]|uniref:Oligopeptide transport system permease protein n=1 Tax=Facklamia miroungae TaxID=120956 RepID=A0A1G7UN14_9LACT|nr:oligopeptide ABC transporter permease OppC [Facklamia miroungae]NKZ30192.1 ABC transporter permease [Facklamia miroungae]SDG48896.1 oligopeptide transport system permease protein [Facklamia miroungae]